MTNASSNSIGGTSFRGLNLISGNDGSGVNIGHGRMNIVQFNYIGTDLNGTAAIPNRFGVVAQSNAVISENVISGNQDNGVKLGSKNVLQGNVIGLDPAGTAAVGNFTGVGVTSGSSNVIGGTSQKANIISGNRGDGIFIFHGKMSFIEGDFIGVNQLGTKAFANSNGIVMSSASSNRVGGTEASQRNFISGNTGDGISIFGGKLNVVVNDYIGLNESGTSAIPNDTGIILNTNALDDTIGGTSTADRNIISGNTGTARLNPAHRAR